MSNLYEKFKQELRPKLKETLQLKNIMSTPRLEKVVVNVGVGSKGLKDDKYIDAVANSLAKITGQKPQLTKARKSISSFKVREGMVVGMRVTLRGRRMYDFVEKLVNIALPRVRDFQGLSKKSFDGNGNFTIGVKEHIIFPEIKGDEIDNIHGLEVVVVTTAKDDESAFALLKMLGFPFKENKDNNK